jgi:hypothetical protein
LNYFILALPKKHLHSRPLTNPPTPPYCWEGWMGCFSPRCECISWAKQELSSSAERPNLALKGNMSHARNFQLVTTHQARVQPKNRNLPVCPCFGETRAWCVVCVANFEGEASPPSHSGEGLFIELLYSCFAQETPSPPPPPPTCHLHDYFSPRGTEA